MSAKKKTIRAAQASEPPLLLHSISQLLTMCAPPGEDGPRRGVGMKNVCPMKDGAVLIAGGRIVSVKPTPKMLRDPWVKQHRRELFELDCSGMVVLPGFVDSHTHPVFTAPRLIDFERRIAGESYEQIAQAGGGIRASLEGVRKAKEGDLAAVVLDVLREMASQGTTTVEAKSGYGLEAVAELKSLRAIRRAAQQWSGTVVPTLLGAHTVPPDAASADAYVEQVCREMIPEAARQGLAKFVDVFCERGAFTPEQTTQVLAAAGEHDLKVRLHLGQLSRARLEPILQYRPLALDHMDHVGDEDISLLAHMDVVVTLLPGANYFLGHRYPPARKLLDAGVPVALATDYNPGSSPTSSMPFICSLACTQMRMSPEEALVAATINGAYALGLQASKGSLRPGKDADLAFFRLDDYREIPYWFGANHCAATMMAGRFCDLPGQSFGCAG